MRKFLWPLGSAAALIACYLLCRYAFLPLHGMHDWPFVLFAVGVIAIAAAATLGSRRTMAGVPVGYMAGFALGMLLRTESTDPGGGATSNAWSIWTASFLLIVALCALWEVLRRKGKC